MPEGPRRKLYRCHFCGRVDETVHMRYCAFDQEVEGEQISEISCDDCEDEHIAAIPPNPTQEETLK